MRSYDCIQLPIKCPNCKKDSVIGLRTHAGKEEFKVYKLGDKFEFDDNFLEYCNRSMINSGNTRYLVGLDGECNLCRGDIDGWCWIHPKTHIIEEIELNSFTMKLDMSIK